MSTDDEVPLAVPVLGTLDELCAVVEQTKPDALVLAAPTGRLDVLNRILELSELPAVLELSSAYELAVGRVPISEINAAWFLRALELSRRTALVAPKRAFDIVVSSALLVLSAPFLALVALAIRLDSPGPVLYRQVRVGERGRLFTMLKFRSMFVDAEIDGARWAEKDDPRVTRVGRVLRRFRIDEVPQVWNVLRGEMTLVGPRPERPELVEKLVDDVPFYESPPPCSSRGDWLGTGVCALRCVGRGRVLEVVLRPLLPEEQLHRHGPRDHAANGSRDGRRSGGPLAGRTPARRTRMGGTIIMKGGWMRKLVTMALMLWITVFAASAWAGNTTDQIINDVAKDGRVDGHYTAAQLRAALASPLLAAYGKGGTGGVAGVQAALGAKHKNTPPSSSTPSTSSPGTGTTGNLPFTGADILLFVGVGGVLLVSGLVLRRAGRENESPAAVQAKGVEPTR